jgi:hypothetical protein
MLYEDAGTRQIPLLHIHLALLLTYTFTNVVMPCRLNALMDSPARFAGAEMSIVCRLVAFPGASRDITWTWVAFGARMYKKLKDN